MADTTKKMSEKDFQQTLRGAFNDVDKSFTTGGFVVGKVGHKIVRTLTSSTVEKYDYYDGAVLLYSIQVTYTSGALTTVSEVERIA